MELRSVELFERTSIISVSTAKAKSCNSGVDKQKKYPFLTNPKTVKFRTVFHTENDSITSDCLLGKLGKSIKQ